MKIYGHPWSINTRKTLMTLAEKAQPAELVLVMLPYGEHKQPAHVARHPWAKVPVLEDDGFILYETRAINRYLDAKLAPSTLVPSEPHALARYEQWTSIADAYFIPHVHGLLVELIFRRYLGGPSQPQVIADGKAHMQRALDVADQWLAANSYFAGEAFSLADIHWMPYFEYLMRAGEGAQLAHRPHLNAWWARVSERPTWIEVARSGPQPDAPGMTADVIAQQYRR